MVIADISIFIYEVFPRPVPVLVCLPRRIIIIQHDWIANSIFFYSSFYIIVLFLKIEFWGVHPDDHESFISILFIPRGDMGKCSDAINAAVCPKINKNHFAFL